MTSIRRILAEIAATPPGDMGQHLTNDQLIAYATGAMPRNQLQICEQHLHHCAECCEIIERLAEAESQRDEPLSFPVIVPELSAVLKSNTAMGSSPEPPPNEVLSLELSKYRSDNRRTIAKVAGEKLTMQDFSNPAGYPLATRHGEGRLYCNLREHNGTTDVSFALRMPDGASPVSIRWERHFAGEGKPPDVCLLTFSSDEPRVELFGMPRPDDTERWSFKCVDTGGAL